MRKVKRKLTEVRKKTRTIYVGRVPVGGGNLVVVQSMTKTDTMDVRSTVNQIRLLEAIGCEIIRLAVPDMKATKARGMIKKSVNIFFFQAEDGIRDATVTGVQTCALPISRPALATTALVNKADQAALGA